MGLSRFLTSYTSQSLDKTAPKSRHDRLDFEEHAD